MQSVVELLDKAISESRDEEYAGKQKTSFWASESEVMAFEIYHRWIGTPPTNPMTEEKRMMLKMRKLTEEAIVHFLRRTDSVVERLTNDERVYFEWGEHKVPISGYTDAGLMLGNKDPVIVEVKTYYGGKQHSEIRNGYLKSSYLKQLAIYLYHHKLPRGVLLMVNQGTGERFEFDLYHQGGTRYLCPDNEIEIDLQVTFRKWERIYVDHILKKVEPPIEYSYKYDIEKIDWANTPISAIQKARNNRAVIGDWQVKYSDYKDLIIERQGTCPGYPEEELARIRELTAGYSQKSNKKQKFTEDML